MWTIMSEELTRDSRATIHVFPKGGLSIRQLKAEYPTFNPRRGDIIVSADESGYRTEGVRLYDGVEIIEQYLEYDDYGSPPIEFRVGTEFPVGYWDIPSDSDDPRVVKYDVDELDMPYWHDESPATAMDAKLIEHALAGGREEMRVGSETMFGVWVDTKFGRYLLIADRPDDELPQKRGDITLVSVYSHDAQLGPVLMLPA
jgi:hypothetical protein